MGSAWEKSSLKNIINSRESWRESEAIVMPRKELMLKLSGDSITPLTYEDFDFERLKKELWVIVLRASMTRTVGSGF